MITIPRYIIISARKEKISVEIAEAIEIVPNDRVVINSVAEVAKNDAEIEPFTAFLVFSNVVVDLLYSFSSDITTIPNVAKTESQRDKSYMA